MKSGAVKQSTGARCTLLTQGSFFFCFSFFSLLGGVSKRLGEDRFGFGLMGMQEKGFGPLLGFRKLGFSVGIWSFVGFWGFS